VVGGRRGKKTTEIKRQYIGPVGFYITPGNSSFPFKYSIFPKPEYCYTCGPAYLGYKKKL
jgi:hypothetical protein